MERKKTFWVWLITVLVALRVVFTILGLSAIIFAVPTFGGSFSDLRIFTFVVLTVVDIILSIIYAIKLLLLKPNILKWTNIIFGYTVLNNVLSRILYSGLPSGAKAETGQYLVGFLFGILIVVVIWVLFYQHLKKHYGQNV